MIATDDAATVLDVLQRQFKVTIAFSKDAEPLLTLEPLPFYRSRRGQRSGARVLVGRLVLPEGATIQAKGKKAEDASGRTYAFLLDPGKTGGYDGARVHRLSSNVFDITKANRTLKLDLDEANGPAYVQFYSEFGELNEPGSTRRSEGPRLVVPADLHDIEFDTRPGADDDRKRVEGALWHTREVDMTADTGRSSRLTSHLRSTAELLRTPLVGWVPAQRGNNIVEAKVRVGRYTGGIDVIRLHDHYASEHILPPTPVTYTRWPEPSRRFQDTATRIAGLAKWFVAYTGALVAFVFGLATLLTPIAGLWPETALPAWMTILGFGNLRRGAIVVFIGSAAALVALTCYNLFWSDLRSIANFCRKNERWHSVGLVKWFVGVVRSQYLKLLKTNTYRARLLGAAGRAVLLTAVTVLAFTSLQLAYDPNPYGNNPGKVDAGQIIVKSWVDPVEHTASLGTMSILLEDIVMQVPGVLSWRGIRPQPVGKDGLPQWLRLMFALVSAFVVIRGVRRYWSATSPDEARPARGPRSKKKSVALARSR